MVLLTRDYNVLCGRAYLNCQGSCRDKVFMIAVIIVTYNSSDVIRNCLESLIHSEGETVRVVVVDNASTDATIEIIRDWAAERASSFQEVSLHASVQPKA